jgi:hypothetical protein
MPNQRNETAKPSARKYAGHLSKIFMKAVLIEDIDSDRRYSDERELATSSYR